jgi:tRNA A-37 threonylcarbamoyl transferase component Bud32
MLLCSPAVSLWDRIARKSVPPGGGPAVTPQSAASPRASESATLSRFRAVGAPDGPDEAEAVSLLRALRASPEEARAIDAVLAAASAVGRSIPESIRVAVAAALADRGENREALALLSPSSGSGTCTSPAARLLAADLFATEGRVAEALALIERVLLVNLDYPGARERHARWRAQLGLDAPGALRPDPSAVTVVSREPDAPFLLLREVARGGAGAVYEAEDRELSRRVALKVYHHPDRDRAQLLHEARVAASLAGKGIVRVLDADPEHGWLALEWAPLGSFRQYLRARDRVLLIPIERWAIPLAAAVAKVHAAGWVHHDLKPANVLLAAPDWPVLTDFGTARRAGEPSPPGSLGYVSPERLAGRASDPRDDVFGFGRILEDALAALAPSLDPSAGGAWHEIASACTGADAGRPTDARALLTRMRVETGSGGVR